MCLSRDARHKLELAEQHTKLNTNVNNLETLKPGGEWGSNAILYPEVSARSYADSKRNIEAEDEEMRDLLGTHKQDKLQMKWCRYALPELVDPQTDKKPSSDPAYFKGCEKQFLHIYEKLEKWEYEKASQFCDDILSIYTIFGKQLSNTQRDVLKIRFQGLVADRSEWMAGHGVETISHES